MKTIDWVNTLPIQTLKLHQLQLIRGTRLAQQVAERQLTIPQWTAQEYCSLCVEIVARLRNDIAIERFVSQSPADLLIYPTAIGYESSDTVEEQQRQREAWTTVQRGHAVANGIPVVTVNRVGFEPDPSGCTKGINFWGSSFVAGPQGELFYQACDDDEESLVIDVDLTHSEQVRRWWPFLRDRRIEEYGGILKRFIDKDK